MKPYYEEGNIIIYNGDCKEILPQIKNIDLVVTDPPYGMNYVSGYRTQSCDPIWGDDKLPLDVIEVLIKKARNAAYFFCRWDNLKEMPKPKSVLAWVKNNHSMGDLKHEHGRMWEAICFYPKEGHCFIKRTPDVIFADRTGNVLHPTEKPVGVMRQLLEANIGEIVLDPFMGSGSTLQAVKELGRIGIGIEIEERYCEIAVKRLEQQIFNF